MRRIIAISMLVAFVLTVTVSVTSFAATSYTTNPTATTSLCVINQTTSEVYWANVKTTILKDKTLFVYGTDFGSASYKSSQAYSLLIPKNLIPSDIRFVKYTYNSMTKKFSKVPVKVLVAPAVAPTIKK